MQVHQLFLAQMHHDRKQRHERLSWTAAQRAAAPPAVDHMLPIIAGTCACLSICTHLGYTVPHVAAGSPGDLSGFVWGDQKTTRLQLSRNALQLSPN